MTLRKISYHQVVLAVLRVTISTMQPWQKLLIACTTTSSNEIMFLRKN